MEGEQNNFLAEFPSIFPIEKWREILNLIQNQIQIDERQVFKYNNKAGSRLENVTNARDLFA